MFYKTKKQIYLSSIFQANLFRHYKRLLAPINPLHSVFQHWLIIISGILLGYALLNSTFIIFGLNLLWCIYPDSRSYLWYTPVSLTFWIFSLSCLASVYSLKVCLTLPKDFRLLLLLEQGLTLRVFQRKCIDYKTKIFFLSLTILFLFFICPKIVIGLIWALPVFCEFYSLSGLTNSFLVKDVSSKALSQTFPVLLGLEYSNMLENNQLLINDDVLQEWLDDENIDTELIGQDDYNPPDYFEMDDFEGDHALDEEDIEDNGAVAASLMYSRKISSKISRNVLTSRALPKVSLLRNAPKHKVDALFVLRQQFPEFHHLQDLTFDLQFHYKKVPVFFRYLRAQKEILQQNRGFTKKKVIKNYKSIETRLWTKTKLNMDVLRLPSQTSWYNTSVPNLYDSLFLEYEEISDNIFEKDQEEDDTDLLTDEEESAIIDENDYTILGGTRLSDSLEEPGAGDEYSSPNWFLISFCYYTIGFWAFLNCFLFVFFLLCGIPENWLLSTRETAGKNILIYESLLHMTEQLYTKWGFTKLPNGFSRLEYFNYMQPSYFQRLPKKLKKIRKLRYVYEMYPWGGRYWARRYKYKQIYGIYQGVSVFTKKYPTFMTYLYREKSSILLENRFFLNQNISNVIYYNDQFFAEKEKQINDFSFIVSSYYNKKKQ